MKPIMLLAITIGIIVGTAMPAFALNPPATATEIDLNLLNTDGSNIDTTLLLTIDYIDSDLNPQSLNSVNNTDIVTWSIYLGKSSVYGLIPAKDGTDINITVDGYEQVTVVASEGGYVSGTYYIAQLGGRTDEFDIVMDAAIANNGAQPKTKAVTLNASLEAQGVTTPLVIDARESSAYSAGHIPYAINIYYRDMGKVSALAYLDSELTAHEAVYGNRDIVVYGNTRHLSRMVNVYLIELGYASKALRYGFSEWTDNETVAPDRFVECTVFNSTTGKGISPPGCNTNNFPAEVLPAVDAATQSGETYPTLDYISGAATPADLPEIVRSAYNDRFSDPAKPGFRISAVELYDLLDDNQDGTLAGPGDDLTNDPFVLSNRGTTWSSPYPIGPYYTAGHIPGAVAVDWADASGRLELRTLNNTDFLPTDRTIVHHCWVGVSQQYGGAFYNMLGYTVMSLDWGMQGWSIDEAVRGTTNMTTVVAKNYPFDTTPNLADAATDLAVYLSVTWTVESAPTMPNFVNVEFYNEIDGVTEELAALPSSSTSYSHTVGATEDGDQVRVYVYFADDASDKNGDPGTSDETSVLVPYAVPEFPLPAGPAILFGMFVPIYYSMRRRFLESRV